MSNDRTLDINSNDEPPTLPREPSHGELRFEQNVPEIIGPYHLKGLIGEGGMGLVYEAEQREPIRRRVALKMVKRGMATEEFITRFEAERQALAVMDHPCIARVIDAGATEDGQPFFVMEYVEGVPLNTYCNDQKLSIQKRLNLFIKVCEGVQHAHQKAIIHRDLKPGNVLITTIDNEPVPKIIDFGVAKVMDDGLFSSTSQTGVGQLVGTPEYMSPEQADFDNSAVDTTTDVYALGVLLYELLVGSLPFSTSVLQKKGFNEILRVIKEVEPAKPSTKLKSLSPDSSTSIEVVTADRSTKAEKLHRHLKGDLDWITMRALEKEKERRYQTANALAMDIRRHLKDEPVLACPPSPTYRTKKFIRRNQVLVGAASFILLAVMAGITGTTIGLIRAVRAEQHAQQEAETALQVSDFLVELFEVADPGQARGNTITAREILDAGAERIETDLVNQPLTQARLMSTIGKVYRNLGLYDQASPKLESALAILQSNPQSTPMVISTNLADLAALYIDQAKYNQAETILNQAIALSQGKQNQNTLLVARSLNKLAGVYRRQGKLEDSEPLYNQAHEIFISVLDVNNPEIARSFNSLGILYYQQGDYDKSETQYKKALELWRRAYGTNHADIAKGLNNLALLYHHQGQYQKAVPRYKEAAVIYEKVLGADHPRYARALNNLALLQHEMGNIQEAEPLYLRSLAIKKVSLGVDHPEVAQTLNNLANLYRDQNDFSKATPLYDQALNIRIASLGANHPDVAWTLRDFGLLKQKQGRNAEALLNIEKSFNIISQALGADHPDLEEILMDYSVVLHLENHHAKADSLEQIAKSIANKKDQQKGS